MPCVTPADQPAQPREPARLGSAERVAGLVLVGLQFGLMAALAGMAGLSRPEHPVGLTAWVLLAASMVMGLAALQANRPGNFNIRPDPHPQGRLVTHGIYRWVRHPMYAAVLLAATAAAASAAEGLRLAAWAAVLALLAVLTVKSMLEERWLAERHEGYFAYAQRTRRFFPGRF